MLCLGCCFCPVSFWSGAISDGDSGQRYRVNRSASAPPCQTVPARGLLQGGERLQANGSLKPALWRRPPPSRAEHTDFDRTCAGGIIARSILMKQQAIDLAVVGYIPGVLIGP